MSKPTAKRLHAKRLARKRKRKPPRQRADTSGWPAACAVVPAAILPLLVTMSATSNAPPTFLPTIRATTNTGH